MRSPPITKYPPFDKSDEDREEHQTGEPLSIISKPQNKKKLHPKNRTLFAHENLWDFRKTKKDITLMNVVIWKGKP